MQNYFLPVSRQYKSDSRPGRKQAWPGAAGDPGGSQESIMSEELNSKYDMFSLRVILSDLTTEFSGIERIYLFGSRRHRTMSTRSDLDLLLVTDGGVRPDDVRDYTFANCRVLDCFFAEHGIATSCANGSKVKARGNKQLIHRLDALKIWDRSAGFSNVDIDWDFAVIKGLNPMMTSLVCTGPLPSKQEFVTPGEPRITEATPRSPWDGISKHPLVVIFGIGAIVAGATFAVIRETRIIPLKEDVDRLQKQVDALSKTNVVGVAGRNQRNIVFRFRIGTPLAGRPSHTTDRTDRVISGSAVSDGVD